MQNNNIKETRMDRIEKNLELLGQKTLDLNNSQIKTDEQLRKTDEQLRKTDEQLRKTDEQLRKTDEQILSLKETQIKTDEQILSLKEAQIKTDEQLRKTDEHIIELKEEQKKTIKKLDAVGRQLGDIGLVQGEVAEDLFYRNVKYLFINRNFEFTTVKRNLKKKGIAEYDIVAISPDEVMVIEVKNKLGTRMVDSFVNKKLPKFKKVFPKYKNFRLLGGIGALVVKDEVGRYAEDAGLYLLTQNNEGGATIINKKNFKPKSFG